VLDGEGTGVCEREGAAEFVGELEGADDCAIDLLIEAEGVGETERL
jgi:hypothetical protein